MLRVMSCALLVGALIGVPFVVSGQQRTFAAGEYIGPDGNGRLQISPATADGQAFNLQSIGANGHTCELEGMIRQGRALLEGSEEYGACEVDFTQSTSGGIGVDSTQGCRVYCGERATFQTDYIVPPQGCGWQQVNRAIEESAVALTQGAFADVQKALEPLVPGCEEVINWHNETKIRNTLAEAYAGLGQKQQCLEALDYLYEELLQTNPEDQIINNLSPVERDFFAAELERAHATAMRCGWSGEQTATK